MTKIPISYEDISRGMIFETEYADYGNKVKVIFDHNVLENHDGRYWLKTVGHFVNGGQEFVGYSPMYDKATHYYDVIV